MAKTQKGSEYYCGECGTTLLVTDVCSVPQSIVCCDVPMIVRVKGSKAKPKAKARKK